MTKTQKGFSLFVVAALLLVATGVSAKTGKGNLYHNGDIVRTVVNQAALPHGGSDPLFVVTNGVEGQLAIAGLAPGEDGYRGGRWAVSEVTFTDEAMPYLLTSDEAVADAMADGDVIVVRKAESDFRCPVLP